MTDSDFNSDKESLAKEVRAKGFKKTSKRLREGKENHLGHRSSLDWRLDREIVCKKSTNISNHVEIEELKNIIAMSRTGEYLLSKENTEALEIYYDSQTILSQFYKDNDRFVITLNPNRPKGDLINMLVRELRHMSQYKNNALVNPMSFEPDGAVLLNRAQQADVVMISIKVAWELKLQGKNEAWGFIATSTNGDIAHAFEVNAQKDFRTLNNGEASRAAYDKFFEDRHTKIYDKHVIHQMLLDDRGYMKSGEKEEIVPISLFNNLGDVSGISNYLSLSVSKESPVDMRYSSVEDRSNANFLWFIKFERSFQEKEMQILEESVKKTAEVVDFAKTLKLRRSVPTIENPSN